VAAEAEFGARLQTPPLHRPPKWVYRGDRAWELRVRTDWGSFANDRRGPCYAQSAGPFHELDDCIGSGPELQLGIFRAQIYCWSVCLLQRSPKCIDISYHHIEPELDPPSAHLRTMQRYSPTPNLWSFFQSKILDYQVRRASNLRWLLEIWLSDTRRNLGEQTAGLHGELRESKGLHSGTNQTHSRICRFRSIADSHSDGSRTAFR
jgi:hypothetical protein